MKTPFWISLVLAAGLGGYLAGSLTTREPAPGSPAAAASPRMQGQTGTPASVPGMPPAARPGRPAPAPEASAPAPAAGATTGTRNLRPDERPRHQRLAAFAMTLDEAVDGFAKEHGLADWQAEAIRLALRAEGDDHVRDLEDWIRKQQALHPDLKAEDLLGMQSLWKEVADLRAGVRARHEAEVRARVPEGLWDDFSHDLRHDGSAIRVTPEGRILTDWDYATAGGWMRVQPRGPDAKRAGKILEATARGGYEPVEARIRKAGASEHAPEIREALGRYLGVVAGTAPWTPHLMEDLAAARSRMTELLGEDGARELLEEVESAVR